jgi:hypothetical protein
MNQIYRKSNRGHRVFVSRLIPAMQDRRSQAVKIQTKNLIIGDLWRLISTVGEINSCLWKHLIAVIWKAKRLYHNFRKGTDLYVNIPPA